VDDNVAQRLAGEPPGKMRLRRLARLQPYGMSKPLTLSELMPPRHEPGAMSERDRRDYEAALDNFMSGRWDDSQQLLSLLPGDGPSQVLRETIKGLNGTPPPSWDGVIVMKSK
jgi:adenylate cyclase